MVNPISFHDSSDDKGFIRKTDIESKPEEPVAKNPVDSLNLTVPDEKTSKQTMRKASIKHYHLHRKNSDERNNNASPEPAKIRFTDSAAAPPYITMLKGENISIIECLGDFVSKNKGYNVSPFEEKLQSELGPKAKIQNDWDMDGLAGEIPTLTKLQDAFKSIAKDKSIPWEYLEDGCYARAHMTCDKLMKEGYNCAKLYAIIDEASTGDEGYPFPGWRFRAENKFSQGEWWYHVAALVFAKDEKTGEIEGYIIDPSVNRDKPIKPADWIRSYWTQDFPIRFDTTYADIYDPPNQSYYPVPEDFSKERFDSYIAEAKETNSQYSEVLEKIKEKYYASHPDEKPEINQA